jgi:predicted ATPase
MEVDVSRFRDLLDTVEKHDHGNGPPCADCVALLDSAIALYRDDFMAGFSLRDGAQFEDWQMAHTEELRQALAGALDGSSRGHMALGHTDAAIAAARRRLALDPLYEPAHQQLMLLYSQAGRRSDALRQYRECVAVLDRELAVAPLEETTQLYQAIKENLEPAAPQRPAVSEPEERAGHYPLVGRGPELETLLHLYESAGSAGRLAAVEGEAGVGKTRLTEELMEHVRAAGGHVLTGRSYEGETHLAYAPFLDVVRNAVRSLEQTGGLAHLSPPFLSEASRLLPDLLAAHPDIPVPLPLDSPGASSRFLEGLSEVILSALRGARPGLLVLEDLHWMDSASLDLVATLIRRLPHEPLCLLVTWRTEQLPAGLWLRSRVSDLQRMGQAATIHLGRLDQAGVLDLVRAIVTGVPGEEMATLARRLHEETEGLPLFVHAYLSSLDPHEPPDTWALPGTLRDLLRAQLAGVSEMGWQVLSAGAVIGHSFDFETVRGASGRDEEMVIAALEELMASGLISEIEGNPSLPAYDFNHEKVRTIVYEDTSLARRRLLHRRVAETMAQRSHGRSDDVGKIAFHFRHAGDDAAAAEYYRRAGERARALYANREALAHFQTALALGHADIAALLSAIGDLETTLGEYAAAVRSYETAASALSGPALARVEHRLGLVYSRSGDWDLAESYLASALDTLRDTNDTAEQARLYADRSLIAHHQGRSGTARQLAEQALTLAEAADDQPALAQTHNILGILANARGAHADARSHLEASLGFATQLNDPAMRAAAANNLALAARGAGDLEEARVRTEEALGLSITLGDRHREAALHNNLADLLHLSGQSGEAVAHVKAAVSIYAEIGVEAGSVRPEIWKLTEW